MVILYLEDDFDRDLFEKGREDKLKRGKDEKAERY